MALNRRCCCLSTLVVVGFVFIIVGVVLIPESKVIIHNEIVQQISLKSQATYDNWVKNPTPIFFQVWVWNLTNPDNVTAGGKPSLVQMGPYTYKETRQKHIIKWNDENGTVTYREDRFFSFDKDKSNGNLEDDVFHTVNIPLMLIANIVHREPGPLQILAQALLTWAGEQELFLKLSVKDIIWGYRDPLLNKTMGILKALGLNATVDDHFGIFVGTNGSDDGAYNIKTGQDDTEHFGIIKSWNYKSNLDYWTTNQSNLLNGTDGTIFHPFVDKSDVMYIFSSDICRSIYLTYSKDETQKGIDVYRFVAPPSVFLNHTANPANQGFCSTPTECLPSGLLDVENCRFGAPVVFSQPHFLSADPKVINAVDGMHPNIEEHQTVVDIEPNTGAAFFAAKKLQVNVQLEQVNHIDVTKNLRHVVLPVIWINETSEITDDLANEFKDKLQTPMKAIHIGIWVAIGLGIAMVVLTAAFIIISKLLARRSYMILVPDKTGGEES